MKTEKQVVYDNLYSVYRRVQNALYCSSNPLMEGAKITVTSVELERIGDALEYIKRQSDKKVSTSGYQPTGIQGITTPLNPPSGVSAQQDR